VSEGFLEKEGCQALRVDWNEITGVGALKCQGHKLPLQAGAKEEKGTPVVLGSPTVLLAG
jgi:hypothetical protein